MNACVLSRSRRALAAVLALSALTCAPIMDPSDPVGKKALLTEAANLLTQRDCASAIQILRPLYNSQYSDGRVREMMASAYACAAGVNLFGNLGTLTSNVSSLSGGGIWGLFAQMFPAATGDSKPEAAGLGIDALQASLNTGAVVSPINQTNWTSHNPGSLQVADRMSDANLFMIWVAMSAIGTLENQYGAPNSAYQPTTLLPWTTPAAVTTDGCAYASAIVNFTDAVHSSVGFTTGTLQTSLASIDSAFQLLILAACDAGCRGTTPLPGWVASGCNISGGCANCPQLLRDRTRCTALVTDAASCAAAGIVNFINVSPLGWN